MSETRKPGRDFVYPFAGILLNAYVVSQAMRAVGKLRHRFAIKPPSIEPTSSMNEEEKALWQRTYRAQINCMEWFSLTTPVFLGGAMVGPLAFGEYGKYVPRVLGAFSILNAYYRHKV